MPQIKTDDMEWRRQKAIDTLTSAFAGNIISMEEYERRASLASAAELPAAIDEVLADLPALKPETGPERQDRTSGASRIQVERPPLAEPGSPLTTGCVMGDRNLTGNWLTGNKVSSFTVMGSTKLDLRDSELPPGPVNIEVFTLMGETKIIVPPGLPVHMNAFAFMAESTAHRSVNQRIQGADTWVEISGLVVMGSITVKAMA